MASTAIGNYSTALMPHRVTAPTRLWTISLAASRWQISTAEPCHAAGAHPQGVDFNGARALVSTCHTDDVVADTLAGFAEAVRAVKADGLA